MSTESPQRTLDDFVEFLALVSAAGIPFSIIGGCAVGVYARKLGQTIFSNDVDLCTTVDNLNQIIQLARANTPLLTVAKLPQPRGIQVAVLHWDHSLEINVLTGSEGLPPVDVLLERSSEYKLPSRQELSLKIADPCHLLTNKRRINRAKDAPHIPILEQFIRVRAISEFRNPVNTPRDKINFVRDYLESTRQPSLSDEDASHLIPHINDPSLRAYLMSVVSSDGLAAQLAQSADHPNEANRLWTIYKSRDRKA
jgi:hypothetical protein